MDNRKTGRSIAGWVARMGLLLAAACALSAVESMVLLPGAPPGVKLGLSNVVTMCCLFVMGNRPAYLLAVLKGFFVLLTRGPVAGLLSLGGGLLSLSVLVLLHRMRRPAFSLVGMSICGAVSHNIGQMVLARLFTNAFLWYYLPVLLVSGVIVGTATGKIVSSLLPDWQRTSALLGQGPGAWRHVPPSGMEQRPSRRENIK